MKKNFLTSVAFALALGLVACDDSTSANGSSGDENPAEESSSSVTPSSSSRVILSSSSSVILSDSEGSSSSVVSSSDVIPGTDPGSSCSVASSSSVTSSSSVESSSSVASSSSEKSSSSIASSSSSAVSSSSEESSSSVELPPSSSVIPSEVEGSCSSVASSSSMKAAWAYLNPKIDYGEFTDERDGQVYKTVKIGTQTWMAENLNYDPGYVSDMSSYAWSGCYNNKADSCAKYGRLYTWEVAMDDASCAYGNSCNPSGIVQGICPSGWHLPTKEEWQQLVKPMAYSVDDNTTYWNYYGAGVELKTVDGWSYYSSSTASTNASGFSALPAGCREGGDGGFYRAGYGARFWSASEDGSDDAYYLYLYYYGGGADLGPDDKAPAFSVRCVQNN